MDNSIFDVGGNGLEKCFDVNGTEAHTAYDTNGAVKYTGGIGVRSRTETRIRDWKFKLVTTKTGQVYDNSGTAAEYDDSTWDSVRVPYDWSIRLDYNANSPASSKGGYLDGGIGVFRTKVNVDLTKRSVLKFDGTYMETSVYLNGTLVKRNYWNNPYEITLNDCASCVDGENSVAVVIRSDQPNARWYPGAGIIRPVTLVEYEDISEVAIRNIVVTTPNLSSEHDSVV